MELFALPLGDCCCPVATITPGAPDADLRTHLPVAGYLIRLDDDRLVLVDTGMSRLHIDDPDLTWRGTPNASHLSVAMRPEDSLLFRLQQLDVAPQDVDYVINTHLHFDHAGNNDLLGDATFFVQREQYEFAKGNPSYPNQYWNLPSLSYELVDGERQLFGGITVIPTPGHTPGHQSVALDLPDTGSVILCGDAIYAQANFDLDDWDGQEDPQTARVSAYALKDRAAQTDAQLFYGHDRIQARSMKWAPGDSYT